jgi:diguanylate cyclase (GGDEF)-like protein
LFKEINDTSGHAAGDLVLKGVARALKKRTRESDTVARVGGDEFALLLNNCPHKRAVEIAELLRQDIAALRVEYDGTVHSIGASIGVSYGQTGMHSASGMLKAADAACYAAKEEGRNRVCMNAASSSFRATGRFNLTDSAITTGETG